MRISMLSLDNSWLRAQPVNLGGMLSHSARRSPQKPAVICGDQIVSYEKLDRSTDVLAHWLLQQGMESGDRVAIHWCNSLEVVTLFFACFKAGLIAVPLNNRLKAPEIAYILRHSKAKLCFSQPELAPLCEEVRMECPYLDGIHTELPRLDTFEQYSVALPDVTPDRVAAIMYTSGTTARPKGVMHTHVSLIAGAEMMSSLGIAQVDSLLAATQLM